MKKMTKERANVVWKPLFRECIYLFLVCMTLALMSFIRGAWGVWTAGWCLMVIRFFFLDMIVIVIYMTF